MKKISLVVLAALALTAALAFAPTAVAQTPAPTASCSLAMQALTAAQLKAVTTQADVDRLRAAQTPLDAAVVTAQKLVNEFVFPVPAGGKTLEQLTGELNVAIGKAKLGNDALQAAITADAAADAAVVVAQAAADKACTGAPGATVTTTAPAPAPVIVRIPSAINTGRA